MTLKPLVMRFEFSDFESLPSHLGSSKKSTTVTVGENDWTLLLFPGGPDIEARGNEEDVEPGMICLSLVNVKGPSVDATLEIIVRDASGNAYRRIGDDDIDTHTPGGKQLGYWNIVAREEILDESKKVLVDGALVVDVQLQIVDKKALFHPNNPFLENMSKLMEDEDCSDVSFKVGDVVIPAHKIILKMNAPVLFAFCDKYDGESPVPIDDTNLEVFRCVLKYVYGKVDPSLETVKKLGPEVGRDIIDAADRYGVVGLKILVESALVQLRILNVDNVVSWLLFAQAKTCPLLKEYATEYFSVNVKDVFAHESSKALMEAPLLMRELMIAISNEPNSNDVRMTVNNLRKRLHKAGLDVDGSREMLVSRWEESKKRQKTGLGAMQDGP